ncbi:MAG: hypothetical protein ACR2OI_01860 [Acidimicrobiia bacterium]
MKTRLTILVSIALLAAACSSDEPSASTGLSRTTIAPSPTTTSATGGATDAPQASDGDATGTTAADQSLPTNPDAVDSGVNTPGVTVPLEVEPCNPPTQNLEAYCQPFELVLGNTRIVWDRYFWGQGTFSKGTVEVFHGDELVAAGPFVGEGSIVEQDEDDNFIFYNPEGTVVAIASPDDITPAIQAALDDLNS